MGQLEIAAAMDIPKSCIGRMTQKLGLVRAPVPPAERATFVSTPRERKTLIGPARNDQPLPAGHPLTWGAISNHPWSYNHAR